MSDRAFNIDSFLSNIRTKGTLKTNRYEMVIDKIGNKTNNIGDYISNSKLSQSLIETTTLRCEAVQFPGMSFATNESIMRLGYGPTESVPYVPMFDQFTATFILDSNARIYKLFHSWVNGIVNFDSSLGLYSPGTRNAQGAKAYELTYREEYQCDISIYVYNDNDVEIMEVIAYNAYPKSLPAIDLSYDSSELMKITIPFAFTDFRVNFTSASENIVAGTRRDDSGALNIETVRGPGPRNIADALEGL